MFDNFFPDTIGREEHLRHLFTLWQSNSVTLERSRAPLAATQSSTGTGKTHLATLAASKGFLPGGTKPAQDWLAALDSINDTKFKQELLDSVGVTVTFNFHTPPKRDFNNPMARENPEFAVGVRMLYSHFHRGEFDSFCTFLREHNCAQVSSLQAEALIRHDIRAHFPLEDKTDRAMIVVVDEPFKMGLQMNPKEPSSVVGSLCTSIGMLITHHPNVHVLMTSLTALDKSVGGEEYRAVTPISEWPIEPIDDMLLSPASVQLLVEQQPKHAKIRLNSPAYHAVLRECCGLARLVTTVIALARDAKHTEESVQALRLQIAGKFAGMVKYNNETYREQALLVAFSAQTHDQSVEQRAGARLLAKEGYLFRYPGGLWVIPPLLLRWWVHAQDASTVSLAAKVILSSAINILDRSEPTVTAVEHGLLFQRQFSHLWMILAAVGSMKGGDDTVLGLLGGNRDWGSACVHPRGRKDPKAVFNQPRIRRFPTTVTPLVHEPGVTTDVPANAEPGQIMEPQDEQNPGFDIAIVDGPITGEEPIITLVEIRFAEGQATTRLERPEISRKFVLTLRNRPVLLEAFCDRRVCFVMGGMREPASTLLTSWASWDATVDRVVSDLLIPEFAATVEAVVDKEVTELLKGMPTEDVLALVSQRKKKKPSELAALATAISKLLRGTTKAFRQPLAGAFSPQQRESTLKAVASALQQCNKDQKDQMQRAFLTNRVTGSLLVLPRSQCERLLSPTLALLSPFYAGNTLSLLLSSFSFNTHTHTHTHTHAHTCV
jgi:hypothetical protein